MTKQNGFFRISFISKPKFKKLDEKDLIIFRELEKNSAMKKKKKDEKSKKKT